MLVVFNEFYRTDTYIHELCICSFTYLWYDVYIHNRHILYGKAEYVRKAVGRVALTFHFCQLLEQYRYWHSTDFVIYRAVTNVHVYCVWIMWRLVVLINCIVVFCFMSCICVSTNNMVYHDQLHIYVHNYFWLYTWHVPLIRISYYILNSNFHYVISSIQISALI